MSEIKRGEIYYIERDYSTTGSEQRAGRPAVIVSNDKNNENSATVEVVYLTTQPKADLPTHVTVRGTSKESTVLCEQISTVAVERVGSICGMCNKQEMESIDNALLISLGISYESPKEKIVEVIKEVPARINDVVEDKDDTTQSCDSKYIAVEAQLKLIQKMYSDLLKQVMAN